MKKTSLIATLMLALASSWMTAQEPASANRAEAFAPKLRISAGDLLDVTVFDTPELSGKLRVDHKGEIVLPVGGTVPVANLTAEEVANAVEARLRAADIMKSAHVNVFVLEYATQGITVMGEVKTPGVYPVQGAHTLFDIISAAGGLTPTAGRDVSITHRATPTVHETMQFSNDPSLAEKANQPVEPGDTVVVSRSGVVYVVGDVARPGGFLIDNSDRLTVLQAIALASGANKTASLGHSKLIRKTPGGRQESDLQLNKLLANKSDDPVLHDGDIIFVPSSTSKNIFYRGSEAAVQMTTGMITYGRL